MPAVFIPQNLAPLFENKIQQHNIPQTKTSRTYFKSKVGPNRNCIRYEDIMKLFKQQKHIIFTKAAPKYTTSIGLLAVIVALRPACHRMSTFAFSTLLYLTELLLAFSHIIVYSDINQQQDKRNEATKLGK